LLKRQDFLVLLIICSSVPYNNFDSSKFIFKKIYLAKFLGISAKFFPRT